MISIFDKHYKRYDAWYDNHKHAYLSEIEAVKKVLPAKGRGLEIGVGTGRFASVLGIAQGVEPSEHMAALARQRGVIVDIATGEDLPFDDETFNYVAIFISLCFFSDPIKVLTEARRVAKKNGKLIIGIVDRESFLGKEYQEKESVFYKVAHLFSVDEVVAMVNELHFNVLSYWQTLFSLPEEITSVQEPIEGFGQGGFVVINCQKQIDEK
ncbi:MAG: methyltransferase domain-containing protein [Candidatus Babeliaceae bacterium]|nr:methyltransferase domain-containing protein [Candidatus Babeliaceae bacterium]